MVLLKILVLYLMSCDLAPAAKILLLPANHNGLVNLFTVVGKKLQARGHEVVVLAQHWSKHTIEQSGIPFVLNDGKVQSPT